MPRHAFPTSPGATGQQRKFINPTPGWVGANVFAPDGKPSSIAVEAGGEIWLTPEEERMTAEAPRLPQDNPFVKQWEEIIEFDSFGEPARTVTRTGTLILTDEPARPVASSRFIPEHADTGPSEVEQLRAELAEARAALAAEVKPPETITGAPPQPKQPPVQGQPSENEVVGTPDAVEANDKALEQRESTAGQRTRKPIPTD
jgi:hypothetical protein